MNLFFPTCHLNGTAPDVLYEQVVEACYALRSAQKALEEATPKARDYPQGSATFRWALEAHASRTKQLARIQGEMQEIALHIYDQCTTSIQTQKEGRS